jgi:hypothetical protein
MTGMRPGCRGRGLGSSTAAPGPVHRSVDPGGDGGVRLSSAPCPRVTPSTSPGSGCAPRSPAARSCAASCATRGWWATTWPGAPSSASRRWASTCSPASTTGAACTATSAWTARGTCTGRGCRGSGPRTRPAPVLATDERVAVGFALHDLELLPTADESRLVGHLGPTCSTPPGPTSTPRRRCAGSPPAATARSGWCCWSSA